MSDIFLWWALIAVAMSYTGIIVSSHSDKKLWTYLSRTGQIVGAIGLFAILLYLAIK